MIGLSNVTNYNDTYGVKPNYGGNGNKAQSFGEMQQNGQKDSYTVYLKTDDMLFSGGNGTGLSFYIKYAEESTEDNPVVIAKGVDEDGNDFEQKIAIHDINPLHASITQMRALEAHYGVDKGLGLSSLPHEAGAMGLNDKRNFIEMFNSVIEEMNTLGRFDLALGFAKNLKIYSDLVQKKSVLDL